MVWHNLNLLNKYVADIRTKSKNRLLRQTKYFKF